MSIYLLTYSLLKYLLIPTHYSVRVRDAGLQGPNPNPTPNPYPYP